MRRRLAQWRSLSVAERRTLAFLAITLPVVAGMLRLVGVARTRRCLARFEGNPPVLAMTEGVMLAAERLAKLAGIAGRRGAVTATCLRQAIAVHWLLRRRGLDPEIKFGVRKHDGQFDAHAWVELQGVALGQRRMEHIPLPGWDLFTPPRRSPTTS